MVTTLMPMGARSRAMGRVIPTMPPLEAEYAAWPTWGKKQTVETHAKRTRALIFVCVSGDLSIKCRHASSVNDASSVTICVRLILPHLTDGEANHVEGSCDVHLQKK